MKQYVIQPGGQNIHQPKPYPFFADESGAVQRQDFWRGRVATIIGFTLEPGRQEINITWPQALAAPAKVIGTYLVTADAEGQFSTHTNPITKFEEVGE